MTRKKTPMQQLAWREIVIMTRDKDWINFPDKRKRHKALMTIVEDQEPIVLNDDEKYQRYLDNRPGLEVTIVRMLLEKKINKEIRGELKINFKVIAYLRRKYNLNPKYARKS